MSSWGEECSCDIRKQLEAEVAKLREALKLVRIMADICLSPAERDLILEACRVA
jgi:hypothetical protein